MLKLVKRKIINLLGINKDKSVKKKTEQTKKKPRTTVEYHNKESQPKKKSQTNRRNSYSAKDSNSSRPNYIKSRKHHTQAQVDNVKRKPHHSTPVINTTKKKAPIVLPEIKEVPPQEGKTRFTDFDLPKEILCGLQDAKFQYCTPIQQQCLPHLLKHKDIAGKAQTGTGKTAAFLISIFIHLLKHPPKSQAPGVCRSLIIAPTRELAIQIHKDAELLGKYCGFNMAVVYGGMDHKKQRSSLNTRLDILVGTPGRLLDYSLKGGVLKMAKTEIFVIDEADRMLDMGFIPSVRRIVGQLPQPFRRQTLLFSATLSYDIMKLVERWQVDPVMIEIEPEQKVAKLIEQTFYSISQDDKFNLLMWIMKNEEPVNKKVLIFVNTRDFTQNLQRRLSSFNIQCAILSGDVPQKKRLTILERFKNGTIPVIIATDVASRGIHVDDITHVINYDLPERPDDYVHRIGRTGRAGREGKSISFLCEYGSYIIPELEEVLEKEIISVQPEPEMLKPSKKPQTSRPRPNNMQLPKNSEKKDISETKQKKPQKTISSKPDKEVKSR